MAASERFALKTLGPGLLIAATGVGAGDLLAAMVAGADFGTTLVWVIVFGAALKLGLNEGVARWQLATGTTLLEGWCRHLGRPFQIYFMVYLVIWSFIVASGLMSACGVAAHALVPQLSIKAWAILQSLVALGLVLFGGYEFFERLMKILIALMVVTLLLSAALLFDAPLELLRHTLVPSMPSGSAAQVLGLMGGVGGSVTLLSYGYWIREKGWRGSAKIGQVRLDLGVGYLLTGVFGVAVLVLAAAVLGGAGEGMPRGSAGLVACADAIRSSAELRFGTSTAAAVATTFLIGVWGAIFTSTLGVWQGVPYLFADYLQSFRGGHRVEVDSKGKAYRGFLLYLAIPPIVLLFLDRPIWVIRLYTVTGGLFMPVLAASLLWLNSRKDLVGGLRNRALSTAGLVFALALFAAIAIRSFVDMVAGSGG